MEVDSLPTELSGKGTKVVSNYGIQAMTNLDSVLKSRDITLLTKVHIVEAMVFPVVTNSFE